MGGSIGRYPIASPPPAASGGGPRDRFPAPPAGGRLAATKPKGWKRRMPRLFRAAALAAAMAFPAQAQTEALQVKEIGSLHVGGRIATLEGLPTKEITFSAGAPPTRI